MHFMVETGLFESATGVITCLKLAESIDKSMTNSPRMRAWLETKSVMTLPDSVSTCAELEVEKTRLEEEKKLKHLAQEKLIDDAFVYFWSNMKLRKAGDKKKTRGYFKNQCGKKDPMTFANELVLDTEARFKNEQNGFDKLHPSTYLNGKRWEDEFTIDKQPSKPSIEGDGSDWRRFEEEML